MGIRLATVVMDSQAIEGPYKAVLLVAALEADDATGELVASQATLSWLSGFSERTVSRALNYLEVASVIGRSPQRSSSGFRAADLLVIAPERLHLLAVPEPASIARSLQRIADALEAVEGD